MGKVFANGLGDLASILRFFNNFTMPMNFLLIYILLSMCVQNQLRKNKNLIISKRRNKKMGIKMKFILIILETR